MRDASLTDTLLLRFEQAGDALHRREAAIARATISFLLLGLMLVETTHLLPGLIAVSLGIWSGGLLFFALLFSRLHGGTDPNPRQPASLVGVAGPSVRVSGMVFICCWFVSLTVFSCALLANLAGHDL
jgi:hypothetical protein